MTSYIDVRRVPLDLFVKWLERDGCHITRNSSGAWRIACGCGSRLAILQPSERELAESTAAHLRQRLECGCLKGRRRRE